MITYAFASDYGAEIEWLSARFTSLENEYGGPVNIFKDGFAQVIDALITEDQAALLAEMEQ